jgi:hypothetical protein
MHKKRSQPPHIQHAAVWALLMATFITELLLYTWFRVQCTQIGYETSRAMQTQGRQVMLQNNLKIELARLKSPERIVKIAQDRFGLAMPRAEQVISLP